MWRGANPRIASIAGSKARTSDAVRMAHRILHFQIGKDGMRPVSCVRLIVAVDLRQEVYPQRPAHPPHRFKAWVRIRAQCLV